MMRALICLSFVCLVLVPIASGASASKPPLCRFPVSEVLRKAGYAEMGVVSVECKSQKSRNVWIIHSTRVSGYYTTGKFFRNPIRTTTFDGRSGVLLSSVLRNNVVQPFIPTRKSPSGMAAGPPGNSTIPLNNLIPIARALSETRYPRDSKHPGFVAFARLMTHGEFDSQYSGGFDFNPANRLYWAVEWYYPDGLVNLEVGRFAWAVTVQAVDAQNGRLGLYSVGGKIIQRFEGPAPRGTPSTMSSQANLRALFGNPRAVFNTTTRT